MNERVCMHVTVACVLTAWRHNCAHAYGYVRICLCMCMSMRMSLSEAVGFVDGLAPFVLAEVARPHAAQSDSATKVESIAVYSSRLQ